MRIGIAGTGGVALANAAWLASTGHEVLLWSPSGHGAQALAREPLRSEGVVQADVRLNVVATAQALAAADVLLIAAPMNAHRRIVDALLPHMHSGQTVIVSSMGSLSSLYLFEAARTRQCDITVASFGTTVFTARRSGDAAVRVLTRRGKLGVSTLPRARQPEVLALCEALFGAGFSAQSHALESTLANVNPISHGPLALFNWTRIERAELWPQYHYMTPQVAAVITRLDAERLALGQTFGVALSSLEAHFARSFGTTAVGLEAIAAELHAKRGGPPGPTQTDTRYVTEDMPFGLAFSLALGRLAGVAMPATQTMLDAASLIAGTDFASQNDLLVPLRIERETVAGLLARVNA